MGEPYNPSKTHFIAAKELLFSVVPPAGIDRFDPDITKCVFDYKLKRTHYFPRNLVYIEMHLEVSVLFGKKRKPVSACKMVTECAFQQSDLDEWIYNHDGVAQMEDDLAATLAGLAYSTTRGMLVTRLNGTFLEGCILPPVSPYALLLQEEEA